MTGKNVHLSTSHNPNIGRQHPDPEAFRLDMTQPFTRVGLKGATGYGPSSKGHAHVVKTFPQVFRDALNLAARVVEEEAITFDEEAVEIMPPGDETNGTKEEWRAYEQTRGRAHSLRRLATAIRHIKPKESKG